MPSSSPPAVGTAAAGVAVVDDGRPNPPAPPDEPQPERDPFRPPRAAHARLRSDRLLEAAREELADGRLAAVRGLLFAAAVGVLVAAWFTGLSAWWAAVPAAAFVVAAAVHGRVAERLSHARRAVRHHERAVARLTPGAPPAGVDRDPGRSSRFAPDADHPDADHPDADHPDADHPYAGDLDLFGPRSLFARLDLTRTDAGGASLAAWLCGPTTPAVVAARQDAVEELRDDLLLRERLDLLRDPRPPRPPAVHEEVPPATEPAPVAKPARVAAVLLGGAVAAAAVWWLVLGGGIGPLLLAGSAQGSLLWWHRERVTAAAGYAAGLGGGSGLLAAVLGLLEEARFETPLLVRTRDAAFAGGVRASAAVARLDRTTRRLENCLSNQFLLPFSVALALPLHHAHAVARWRLRFGDRLPAWTGAAATFESLLALARWRFERPDCVRPTLADSDDAGPHFTATGLGHPLLPAADCVRNDLRLSAGPGGDAPALLVVSGSNMSGKSTLLRAVGVNAVLAQAGAAVCADRLSLTPLRAAGVMRVSDSLAEGRSLFFESVRRLRAVLDAAASCRTDGSAPPVLFLLDEILQGTNSADRLTGAGAVLRTLLDRGAIGLVTTHDLALTAITDEFNAPCDTGFGGAGRARNVHFRDTLAGGRMTFDHTLRDGVVPRSNALELMRLVGILEPAEEPGVSRPLGGDG